MAQQALNVVPNINPVPTISKEVEEVLNQVAIDAATMATELSKLVGRFEEFNTNKAYLLEVLARKMGWMADSCLQKLTGSAGVIGSPQDWMDYH